MLRFRHDRDHLLRQNEKNEGYLHKVIAVEDAREKADTESRLERYAFH